jgi:hypothetical protein
MSGSKQMDMIRQMFHNRLAGAAENSLYATIKEVDEAKRTCKAEIGNILYEDILLYSVENADLKGFVFIPAIDSIVLVSRVGTDRMFVESFSEIDKVIFTLNDLELVIDADNIDLKKGEKVTVHVDAETMKVQNDASTIEINPDEMLFNGGDLGGLIKIQELTDKINTLIDTFNKHTHMIPSGTFLIGAQAGVPNPAPVSVQKTTDTANSFNKGDYENEKVKH